MKKGVVYIIGFLVLYSGVFIWSLFGWNYKGIPFAFYFVVLAQIILFCCGAIIKKISKIDSLKNTQNEESRDNSIHDTHENNDRVVQHSECTSSEKPKTKADIKKVIVRMDINPYLVFKVSLILIFIFLGYMFVLNGRYSPMTGNLYFDKWNQEIIEIPIKQIDRFEKIQLEKHDAVFSLYKALLKKNYTEEELGGSLMNFRKIMRDHDNRKKVYDWIVSNNDFQIGNYDSYEKRLSQAYSQD